MLNGIHESLSRSDAVDRTIFLEGPALDGSNRKTREQVWQEFQKRHPYLLGGLLDGLVAALQNKGHFKLPELPRMADFLQFASGAEEALATEILSKGGSEQDVADVLGISPAIVRKHYAKRSQARQERVISIIRSVHGQVYEAPVTEHQKSAVN